MGSFVTVRTRLPTLLCTKWGRGLREAFVSEVSKKEGWTRVTCLRPARARLPAYVRPVFLFLIPFLLASLHKACKCGTNGSWGELAPQQDVEEVPPLFSLPWPPFLHR